MKIAANSYIEPDCGCYIFNPAATEAILGEPQFFCVVDLQTELDAYKCEGLVPAVQRQLMRLRGDQSALFILWPAAGPVVPEIALPPGVPSQTVLKKRDGGEEIFCFWEQRGRPANIQILGLNMNVCIFNAVSEFILVCRDRQAEPPLIHFRAETLADTNYLDDPAFGWDHFRHVISAYCPEQGPPADTQYVAASPAAA